MRLFGRLALRSFRAIQAIKGGTITADNLARSGESVLITRIWAKPLQTWTLLDLVTAVLLISLVSIGCGIALAIAAVIPATVIGRGPRKTRAVFTPERRIRSDRPE